MDYPASAQNGGSQSQDVIVSMCVASRIKVILGRQLIVMRNFSGLVPEKPANELRRTD